MKVSVPPRLRARCFRLFAAGTLLVLLAFSLVAQHLRSGTELVRLRHAMLLGPDLGAADWTPSAPPADFLFETRAPSTYFTNVTSSLELDALPDDWARARAISRHLLGSAVSLKGGAVQHDLRHTHEAIVHHGQGYCGDFVRVFTAIANAAGLTVRPWAFSFDGFGGHGHIWVEVWNRQLQRWQLVDIFQNYYFTDGADAPLSALDLRRALLDRSATLRLHTLHEGVPPGWADESKAWEYLRRGISQWYVPWGNNVFAVDESWPTRLFAGVSVMLKGLGNVASGVQPSIRILADEDNRAERAALQSLRQRLMLAQLAGVAGMLLWAWALYVGLRRAGDVALSGGSESAGTGRN